MMVPNWNMAVVLFLHTALSHSSITEMENAAKSCPSDSILTREGECECDLESCPSCEPASTKTIVQKGLGMPGKCCDQFTCAPTSGVNCTNVKCPEMVACPADSYRLPAITSENDCCPASQGCQCLPHCETFTCAAELIAAIVVEGSNVPGKCCPVYRCIKPDSDNNNPEESSQDPLDCLTDNTYKKNGVNWTSSDFCTTCFCKDGQAICHAFACTPCLRPIVVPGQCCPRCDDIHVQPSHCPRLSNCTERCLNGNAKDENGCVTCQCRNCPPDCTSEIGANSEQICKCDNRGLRNCSSIANCHKSCIFGYRKDERGCDVCECEECNKQCSWGYSAGKYGFSICECIPWPLLANSSTRVGVTLHCKTEGNILRDSGETWFDGCRQCSCIDGREMCSLIHCSPFTCSYPVVNATSNCCPFCPDDPVTNAKVGQMACSSPNGDILLEGEIFTLDEGCTFCICHNGMALCRGKDCPPILCSKPLAPTPGDCCPRCSPENDDDTLTTVGLHGGNDVECSNPNANKNAWRESSCLSCRCVANKKYCFTELCDSTSKCKRSLTIKGKCCPICIDKTDKYKLEGMCFGENSSYYYDGEEWTVDLCTRCKCISGRTECIKIICPQSCFSPLQKSDSCCLSCGDSADSDYRILLVVLSMVVIGAGVALVVCFKRYFRSKKQKIRLRDLGCLPPQYQYKYIRTSPSPYDSKSSQKIILSEKTSLAPV